MDDIKFKEPSDNSELEFHYIGFQPILNSSPPTKRRRKILTHSPSNSKPNKQTTTPLQPSNTNAISDPDCPIQGSNTSTHDHIQYPTQPAISDQLPNQLLTILQPPSEQQSQTPIYPSNPAFNYTFAPITSLEVPYTPQTGLPYHFASIRPSPQTPTSHTTFNELNDTIQQPPATRANPLSQFYILSQQPQTSAAPTIPVPQGNFPERNPRFQSYSESPNTNSTQKL